MGVGCRVVPIKVRDDDFVLPQTQQHIVLSNIQERIRLRYNHQPRQEVYATYATATKHKYSKNSKSAEVKSTGCTKVDLFIWNAVWCIRSQFLPADFISMDGLAPILIDWLVLVVLRSSQEKWLWCKCEPPMLYLCKPQIHNSYSNLNNLWAAKSLLVLPLPVVLLLKEFSMVEEVITVICLTGGVRVEVPSALVRLQYFVVLQGVAFCKIPYHHKL